MPSNLEMALDYVSWGWAVFPLVPGTKKPITTNGFKDATTDLEQVRAWWTSRPEAGIGTPVGAESGLAVIDLDRHGVDGVAEAKRVFGLDADAHTGPVVATGGGGVHLYCRHSGNGLVSRTGAKAFAPGVELLAADGYVVLPPSVHESGVAYTWLRGGEAPDLPAWALEPWDVVDRSGKIAMGGRNTALTSAAGTMRRNGAEAVGIEAGLGKINDTLDAPLPAKEVEKIAKSVATCAEGDGTGEIDEATGKFVLSVTYTVPTAQRYVEAFHTHPDGRTLHAHGGELMEWREAENKYVAVEDGDARSRLQGWLAMALKRDGAKLVQFPACPAVVGSALETIKNHVFLPMATKSPSWANPRHPWAAVPASELIVFRSGSLHVPTGTVLPPTPALFNTCALGFDYNPDAPTPARWMSFLNELFADDVEQIQLLQEWAGYCLTADMRQHKALLIVGPRRAGKGTIVNVLEHLVGAENTAGPTVKSLCGEFGLQPLLNKSLATISDARFHGPDMPIWTERFLIITGGNGIDVNRKYRDPLTDVHLGVRFVIASNELPRIAETSGAFTARLLVLRLTRSFIGHEDPDLLSKLTSELPGILNWSLEGLKRLQERGRFVQPQSVEDVLKMIEDLSSPVSAFVEECCDVGPGKREDANTLYEAWRAWCNRDGRDIVSIKSVFGRDLTATVAGVKLRRNSHTNPVTRFYQGITLKPGWRGGMPPVPPWGGLTPGSLPSTVPSTAGSAVSGSAGVVPTFPATSPPSGCSSTGGNGDSAGQCWDNLYLLAGQGSLVVREGKEIGEVTNREMPDTAQHCDTEAPELVPPPPPPISGEVSPLARDEVPAPPTAEWYAQHSIVPTGPPGRVGSTPPPAMRYGPGWGHRPGDTK